LAQTNPCRVSVINTGPTWRTMRFASRRTISVTAGSLSHSVDQSSANWEGVTSASSTTHPSAFDTIFDVTTTTSPSCSGVDAAVAASTMTSARSAPSVTSGIPDMPKMCRPVTG